MSARERIVPVFVPHRGCPHQCVFCNQHRISGSQESATVQDVQQALEQAAALPRDGVKRQLAFYGGSFTAIPEKEQDALLKAAKAGLDKGWIDSIRLSTRPDAIDEAVLLRMKLAGVETIELGVQSMDEDVLRLSGRGHNAESVCSSARLIQKSGFRLILQMMTGLPGDTDEKDVETARKLIDLRPDGVRIYPTVIIHDTMLEVLWRKGLYQEHSVEDAVRIGAVLLPMFLKAGIPVIRFGLNPTEELSDGAAVGGAYHPALGELVKSRCLRNRAEHLLQKVGERHSVCIGVAPEQLSQMIGQHRENVVWLQNRFGLKNLRVIPTNKAERDTLLLMEETDFRGIFSESMQSEQRQ